jgi:phosphatidylethanolamine/phosphatidyl-N-methylethanolamine N-methyltransferase
MIYDKLAERYDRALAPFEKRFLSNWRRETLSSLPAGARLLEVGAGTGANFEFYPRSAVAVASEISREMLKLAREKTSSIALVRADAEVLPFAANSFDAAFATLVFCSIAKPENAFAELRRVVAPRGKIALLEHVRPPGALGFVFDALNLLTVPLFEDHFNRRTAETAAGCGLRVLEVRRKAFGIVNLIVCENEKSLQRP